MEEYRSAQQELDATRRQSVNLVKKAGGIKGLVDTDYIFLAKTAHLGLNMIGSLVVVATGVLIPRLGRQ